MAWLDVGRSLQEEWDGPWRSEALGSESFEIDYLPAVMHKPEIAPKSGVHQFKGISEHKNLQSAQLLHQEYGKQLDPGWASCDPSTP